MKKGINWMVGIGLMLGIALLLLLVAGQLGVNTKLVKQEVIPGNIVTTQPGVTSSASQCPVNPSVVTAFYDTLNPGTAISGTVNYRLNGAYLGTTSPTTSGTADMLISNASYISAIKSGVAISCNSNLVTGSLLALTNATLTYYSDTGLVALVQSTANETVKGAGSAYNWRLHFQGVDKKSTGKQLLIVELSVPANVSNVVLTPQGLAPSAQVVAVPNGYTRQATNGYAVAFLIPAVTGANAVDYTLSAQSASSKVITGQVYTTILNVQPFVETDGTFSDVGNAYDSLNTAKFATSQTKNFIIA